MASKSRARDLHPQDPDGMRHSAPRYVVVELRQDSGIAISNGFRARARSKHDPKPLNDALEKFDTKYVKGVFAGLPAAQRLVRSKEPRAAHDDDDFSDFAQAGFAQIVPSRDEDCEDLARHFKSLKGVAHAYVEPQTVPAGKVRLKVGAPCPQKKGFESAQAYLGSAPGGINAFYAWQQPGGNGAVPGEGGKPEQSIKVVDIEGNWDLRHLQLPRRIRMLGGERMSRRIGLGRCATENWKNHGTAVLGLLVSRADVYGTIGICNRAQAMVQAQLFKGMPSDTPREYTDNMARAIRNAANHLSAGDVILLELQAYFGSAENNNLRYLPCQVSPAVFKAIQHATQRGITVVQAAANSNLDLDRVRHRLARRDSGAIVVGAGVPPTNYFVSNDYDGSGSTQIPLEPYTEIGVPRSRLWFSNYGSIVNVQAWGMHVATLGYGDAHDLSRRQVTLNFSGTSSASAMIAGVAVCMQGRARAVRGEPLDPLELRNILIRTGWPQAYAPESPISKWIGPQPDLARAFDLI